MKGVATAAGWANNKKAFCYIVRRL